MQKGAHFLKRTVLFWILLLTILPYLYPMRYSEFLKWDDDLYLTKNKNIQKEDGFFPNLDSQDDAESLSYYV
jgi:hypothetical protein